jgi:hypothetical protein
MIKLSSNILVFNIWGILIAVSNSQDNYYLGLGDNVLSFR